MTSRLCSMTMIEWPASSRRRNDRISLAMSSKCRPVVGSSNMKSVPLRASPWRDAERLCADSARKPASFRRCASPPESVGTGWPSLTYSRPTSTIGCSSANHLAVVAKQLHRLGDGEVEDVGDRELADEIAGHAPIDLDVEDLGAKAPAVAVGAAQVDVGEELHLDVLEARAAAGRAAAVAGVEAEHAGAVAALHRHRLDREQLANLVERADVARRVRARRLADRALIDEHRFARVDRRRAARRARRASRSPCRSGVAAPGRARPASACSCPIPRRR